MPEAIRPGPDLRGRERRHPLQHEGGHGRGVGGGRRRAEEAGQVSERGWWASPAGPGNGGVAGVDDRPPGWKNDVLPPSGAVIAGFCTVTGLVIERAVGIADA